MNKRVVGVIAAAAVAALLVVGGIAAAKPVTSVKQGLHGEFNGDFWPKVVSKTKPTPISFLISGKMKAVGLEYVPPLKELVLEGDRNVSINVKGVPLCESGGRSQRMTPGEVRKACGEAVVGNGRMKMEINFPEQPPIPVESELLVLNGGFEWGVTTLYLYAYITVPTPASIISTIKVKRINKGRFGLLATTTFPKIAGGSGSVNFFKLRLKKGILSAKCPDGHLNARGTAVFGSTPPTRLKAAVSRPCTGKD